MRCMRRQKKTGKNASVHTGEIARVENLKEDFLKRESKGEAVVCRNVCTSKAA